MSWQEQMRQVAEDTAPSEVQVARTRRSIRAGRSASRWPVFGGLMAAGAAFAAVAVWVRAPEPALPTEVAIGVGEQRLAGVHLRSDGTGDAVGAGKHWEIAWSTGALGLVVPDDGAHEVVVRTPEAVVRVLGTAFEVDRDALGTAVRVASGEVHVVCTAGAESRLAAGEDTLCLPATSAGLLGRARALSDDGAPQAEVLASLDAGRALNPEPAVAAEIEAARIGPLMALARPEEALGAAEAYLGLPDAVRSVQVRRVAASLAMSVGGCERALAHLRAIESPTEGEIAQREACERG